MLDVLLLTVSPARHTLGSIWYAESVTGDTARKTTPSNFKEVLGRYPSGFP